MAVALALLSSWGQSAWAQGSSTSEWIAEANAALSEGDYPRAEKSVRSVINLERVRRVEHAEAYRILGIIKFYEESLEEARSAFLSYLKLDPDAHLDPALVPPEAITLFEDVRAKNLAEIDSMRIAPPKKRYLMLNLVPVGGQIQNGDTTKAWLVGSSFALFAAANVGSYALLKNYCDGSELTCESNGSDKTETARTLKTVNLISGVGLITVYLYSVVDGVRGYRRLTARDRRRRQENDMSFQVASTSEATTLSVSFRY
jgi:hypothetical protein